jgi:NADH-quinone oxidoreductase subunit J
VLAQNIVFGLLAAAMVLAALRMVTTLNVVHAALYLVIVLAGMAAMYVLLAAEFVAVAQVLVYIGSVMVLVLFGIMLTRAPIGRSQDLDNSRNQRALSGIVALFLFGTLSAMLIDAFGRERLPLEGSLAQGAAGGNTVAVSDQLFSTYLIPFEVASILLLAALIGAIVVARRD